MRKHLLLTSLLTLFIFNSCSSTKYVKFQDQANEIFPSNKLKSFLQKNKSPKVVLRIPQSTERVTESDNKTGSELDYSYLYDAIEKELLTQGFIVRDRQLFNQVVSNEDNNIDYSVLKEKTDTDLIIELSKLDTEVLYETNKYYTDKSKEGVLSYMYKRYGASVEFKIIMIEDNEFAGTYTFNYTPCKEDKSCEINNSFNKTWKKIAKGKMGYEGVEKNSLEIFMRDATRQLVESMRE